VHAAIWIGGAFSIEAAAVVGIDVGDQFQLVAPGGTEPIGTAVVSDIIGGNATLKVSPGATWDAATDVVAIPTRLRVPKALVHVDIEDGGADALRKLIDGSIHLAVSDATSGILARIVRTAGGERLLSGERLVCATLCVASHVPCVRHAGHPIDATDGK
jgi:hypothetical protein